MGDAIYLQTKSAILPEKLFQCYISSQDPLQDLEKISRGT